MTSCSRLVSSSAEIKSRWLAFSLPFGDEMVEEWYELMAFLM